MSDALVERALEYAQHERNNGVRGCLLECAQRIEQLERELAEAKDKIAKFIYEEGDQR